MVNEQEEIVQLLNSEVSYWDGLKSSEFWREFREKGNLTFSTIYLLIAVAAPFTLAVKPELDSVSKVTLVLLSVSLLVSVISSFTNQLRLFQLNRQLKIIKAAQLEQ